MFNMEINRENRAREVYSERVKKIKQVLKLKAPVSSQQFIRGALRRVSDFSCLHEAYMRTCRELQRSRQLENVPSPAEDEFEKQFRKRWRLRLYRQVWIGNLCADFFVPSLGCRSPNFLRGFQSKGIVFEIDGDIHQRQWKLRKDEYKDMALYDLGFSIWRVEDSQVYRRQNLPERLTVLREFGKTCHREQSRIWRTIYLQTLLYHGTQSEIENVFPQLKTAQKCLKMPNCVEVGL